MRVRAGSLAAGVGRRFDRTRGQPRRVASIWRRVEKLRTAHGYLHHTNSFHLKWRQTTNYTGVIQLEIAARARELASCLRGRPTSTAEGAAPRRPPLARGGGPSRIAVLGEQFIRLSQSCRKPAAAPRRGGVSSPNLNPRRGSLPFATRSRRPRELVAQRRLA